MNNRSGVETTHNRPFPAVFVFGAVTCFPKSGVKKVSSFLPLFHFTHITAYHAPSLRLPFSAEDPPLSYRADYHLWRKLITSSLSLFHSIYLAEDLHHLHALTWVALIAPR